MDHSTLLLYTHIIQSNYTQACKLVIPIFVLSFIYLFIYFWVVPYYNVSKSSFYKLKTSLTLIALAAVRLAVTLKSNPTSLICIPIVQSKFIRRDVRFPWIKHHIYILTFVDWLCCNVNVVSYLCSICMYVYTSYIISNKNHLYKELHTLVIQIQV